MGTKKFYSIGLGFFKSIARTAGEIRLQLSTHSSEKLSHMRKWEHLSCQRSFLSTPQETHGCLTTVALSLFPEAVKSKIGEVFFWPGCYTVYTCKRETADGPQERKHHEHSNFKRWHKNCIRQAG